MRHGIACADSIRLHVRHGLHSLGRSPAFSIVVTLVLALGIAGSTVVYGVARALLFRPIPYAEPGGLLLVSTISTMGNARTSVGHTVASWALFERLNQLQTTLAGVAASWSDGANVSGDGWTDRLQVDSVTHGFLPLVAVRPVIGRGFLEAEYQFEHCRVALVSHSLWRQRFAGDPAAIGRTVLVNDTPHTIVGVLPADYRSIDELGTGLPRWSSNPLGLIVPLAGDPMHGRRGATPSLRILARTRDHRMLAAARREVALLTARFSVETHGIRSSYTLTPLTEALSPGVPERLSLLAVAVAVLLLVACANGALLVLQRWESRRHEMEVRAALGATPRQLAGQALVEAALLGAAAGVVGLALTWEVTRIARTAAGATLSGLGSMQIGWSGVAVAVGLAFGTALLAGVVPLVRLVRGEMASSWLRAPGTSHGTPLSASLPSWMAVAQISLSVALIVVTAMLARDFSRAAAVDIGYEADGVLSAQVAVNLGRHTDGGARYFSTLLGRIRESPGVEAAALVFPTPGDPILGGCMGRVEGFGNEILGLRIISPSLFSLLRVPVQAGRMFTDAELEHSDPVIVVNAAFAERYWGSARAAVGRLVHIGAWSDGRPGPPVTIVGVVRDMAAAWLRAWPEMYMPYTTMQTMVPGSAELSVLVRAAEADLAGLGARLSRLAQDVDSRQPLYNIRPLRDVVRSSLARTRLLLILVAAFSALATLLAGVGVYVILAFAVTRRTREFGIRLALGANRRDVLWQVLGGTLRLVAKGVSVTVPLTYGAMWLVAAQLFGVTETEPIACAWAIGIVLGAALVASLAPAWRATRADPVIALRHE